MPNGDANITGNVFEILHADRHSAGHYRCSADNRVGAADTREIFVNVLCKTQMTQSIFYRAPSKCIPFSSTEQSLPKLKWNANSFTQASAMRRN